MKPEEIRAKYHDSLPLFERAGRSVRDALVNLIDEARVSHLAVSYRVKGLDSVLEKASRKDYSDPFKENTDFIGIRAIVYYVDDVTRVTDLIGREFEVLESEDKAENLGVQELGYRSHHLIVRIRDSWLAAPNYRGLGDCKIEIQVRTVLMHAWAEIEHKLKYKSKQQVPKELQRRLYLLSAKFEEADSQFRELRDQASSYRDAVSQALSQTRGFDMSLNLDLDTLEAFLKYSYPNYKQNRGVATNVFEQVAEGALTFKDLSEIVERFRPYEPRLVQEYGDDLTAANTLGYALDVFDYKSKVGPGPSRKKMIKALKQYGAESS